jgi:hypothetical protein
MMAVEGTRWAKTPKTRRIRELLDQEKGRVKLMWILSHSGITRTERVDEAAKNALEECYTENSWTPAKSISGRYNNKNEYNFTSFSICQLLIRQFYRVIQH